MESTEPTTEGRRTAALQGAPERIEVRLELERDVEPITGRVLLSGSDLPFTGWLGLASALQRGLDDAR